MGFKDTLMTLEIVQKVYRKDKNVITLKKSAEDRKAEMLAKKKERQENSKKTL